MFIFLKNYWTNNFRQNQRKTKAKIQNPFLSLRGGIKTYFKLFNILKTLYFKTFKYLKEFFRLAILVQFYSFLGYDKNYKKV